MGVLIPGVTSGGATQNVGGMEARGTGGLGGSLTIHGGGTPGTSLMGVNLATFGQELQAFTPPTPTLAY